MKKEFYINSRKRYLDEANDCSITILFSGKTYQKTADQDFPFEVNKNFYYLTGINQADVTLLLVKNNNITREYLFIEENDDVLSKWVGMKLTIEEASNLSGIEEVLFKSEFSKKLFNILNPNRKTFYEIDTVYLDLERKDDPDYTNKATEFSHEVHKLYPDLFIRNAYLKIIHLRMIKTPEEVELIQKSIDTTKMALERVLKNIKPNMYEYQIETFYDSAIKYDGNKDKAFDTICAAGKNATILHYVDNNAVAKDGDLILFDLGCRTDFYVSDISRTYPVNKKFTKRQAEIYQIVLDTNKKCIEFLKPGLTWSEYNQYANSLLINGLKKLDLIKDDSELVNYYWHSIGHSIGLDTHDPVLSKFCIQEGMVLTVEPGLYLENEGIGIRIEDNVLITKTGAINLSKDIIKEIKDIEKYML
jgi:Xaa-Pro aminopeptidase